MTSASSTIHSRPGRTSSKPEPTAIILLYHRVVDLPSDPQALCVTPDHFTEHLSVLTEHFRPISLKKLTTDLEKDTIQPRSVVLTFDDGYADNLLQAQPRLAAAGVPATVFVAAGYVGGRREFWWDELERYLLTVDCLPNELFLLIEGVYHNWRIDSQSTQTPQLLGASHGWTVMERDDPTPRHRIYRELFDLLRPLDDDQRCHVLTQLSDQTRCEPCVRSSHRALTENEVEQLAASELLEVGAHTMTHPVLARRTAAQQTLETQYSKTTLETMTNKPVSSFSYPFGTRCDYTAGTVAAVRDAGFRRACSNFNGLVNANTDPFQLPRVLVRDWDGETLMRKIEDSFCAV